VPATDGEAYRPTTRAFSEMAEPGDITDATAQPGAGDGPSSPGAELNVLARALGALAGGIGVLGFVVLIGGTITYARFSAAGLPADEAVSNVPRAALLALGAKSLTPFAVLVILGAVVLFIVDRPGDTRSASRRLMRHRLITVSAMAMCGLALHVLLTISTGAHPPWWTYVIALAAAALLVTLIAFTVKIMAFHWYVLATVIAAGLFAETSELIRTYAQPTVRPVAVALRSGGAPIAGMYIAETGSQVFIGEVCTIPGYVDQGEGAFGYMQVVPRAEIVAMAIGTNSNLPASIAREQGLLATVSPGKIVQGAEPTHIRLREGEVWCTNQAALRIDKRVHVT